MFEELLGAENVVERKPTMGGDDFGRYGREEPRIPSVMLKLGSVAARSLADPDGVPSLHSSTFLPEKGAIRTGVVALSAAALELLDRPAGR